MFDIIVPIFRIKEDFLKRALDSISNQEISKELYSVFVVDGTPTHHQDYDAESLVASYGFNYLLQSHERKLVGGARNQGVSAGSNPYLAFLDGDDYWYASYLREMAEEIANETDDKVCIWTCALDCEFPVFSSKSGKSVINRVYGYYPEYLSFLESHPSFAYYWLLGHPPAPTGTIIKRNVFEEANGYDEELGIIEDTDLLLRIVGDPRNIAEDKRKHYHFISYVGGYHYIGEENTTKRGTQSGVTEITNDIQEYFNENGRKFRKRHPQPLAEELPKGTPNGFLETTKGVMRETKLTNL
jgi:glycosyltransferase involved in cell wall biosynthesis